MTWQHSWRTAAWCGLVLAVFFAVNGCTSAPSPQPVHATAFGIPDHSTFAGIDCLKCHALDRPAPVIDTTTGAAMIHGGGQDCGLCHTPPPAGPVVGTPWRIFSAFSHTPTPASCLDCHASAQPAALVNQMLHSYPGVGDCVSCHAPDAGVTWANGTYTHEPIPHTCVECHSAERPTALVNGFSHDAGGMGDCVSCHHSVGLTWADGFFSHSPAPAKCSDCHAGDRPTGPVPVGAAQPFDHADHNGAGLGDCKSCHIVFGTVHLDGSMQKDWTGGNFSHSPAPLTCIDCHLGKRPVGAVGTPPFDHANGGTGDCVSCHSVHTATPTDADWAGGIFSHNPVPASCIGCHAPDRPAVPVGSPAFDHSIAGMGDCKSCHAVESATKMDWTGGNFSHVPAPTTCIDCHLAQRPATATASGFNHLTMGGTGDCAACHQNPGVTWAGATNGFDHSTLSAQTRCDSCHEDKRPAAPINVPWPGNATRPNQFLHSVMATTDCKGCHLDPGGAWTGGTYAHTPDPGQCTVCHLNQRLPGLVGAPAFDHAAHNGAGLGDCAICHKSKPAWTTDWTGGVFSHINPSPSSCIDCHAGDRPTGAVGPAPGFNHANAGNADCVLCHTVTTAHPASLADWGNPPGVFSHLPKPTLCASCHLGEKPASLVSAIPPANLHCCDAVSTDARPYQNDYLHSLVAGDCAGCHTVTVANPDRNDPNRWKVGLGTSPNAGKVMYSHSPAPASCVNCHGVLTRPDATYAAFNHTQPGLADCKTCHAFPGQRWTGASAVPSSVTLTPPTGKAWGNITAPHPVIDAAKTGLTCTTCHGANTSAKIIGYDHGNPVSGSKCVYCHYTGQTETSASVTTKNHGSASNTKDCTSSGCHTPRNPTWNATSKTFTGGSWGEP